MRGAALLLALALFAGRAWAQTCTLPSAGAAYTSATSLATIQTAIAGASDNAVVCFRRGNTWTGGLSYSTNHPNGSRVHLCSSDDTECTTGTGGANAKFNVSSGQCHNFGDSSLGDGYTISNIDCTATGGQCNSLTPPLYLRKGTDNVWIDGGVYDGWPHLVESYNVPEAPDNVDFGSCANRIEYKNCTRALAPRAWFYGVVSNSTMAVWLHDWGHAPFDQGKGHVFDFNPWSSGELTSTNVVVECSLIEIHGLLANGMGSVVKVANGSNIIVRDNVVIDLDRDSGSNQLRGFDLEGHSDPIACAVDGAQIYRNAIFVSNGAQHALGRNKVGRNVDVYNNVVDTSGNYSPNFYGGHYSIESEGAGCPATWAPDNTRVFNNTFHASGSPQTDTVRATHGTGHHLFNNLLWNENASGWQQGAQIFETSDCGKFGANGANIHDNFVFSPNDPSPEWSACGGANWTDSTSPWNTAPGVADTTPDAGQPSDFAIDTPSDVYQKGTASGAPATDFTGDTRPIPPSIGAYDVTVDPPPVDEILLTDPNGGGTWTADTTAPVAWSTLAAFPNAKLEISTTGCTGTYSTLVASTPNDGSHTITVPDTPSATVCLRISDAADGIPSDTSDAVFTIAAGPEAVTVLTPNGAENWVVGEAHDITWTHDAGSTFANAKIDLSTTGCGGAFSVAVSASTTNDGSFAWTVPNNAGASSCIRIQDAADATPSDTSAAVFTITALDGITVTVPNGGESYAAASLGVVQWSKVGVGVPLVKIEYAPDSCAGTYSTMIASTTNDGAEFVFWPDAATVNGCLRIGDVDGTPIDTSDAVFTLTASTPPPALTIPGGGLFR